MSDQETKAWLCTVCGYVHQGVEPPEECPVCGAPAAAFEPYEAPEAVVELPVAAEAWRCATCGYIHRGPEPPEECPICGAPADAFEPYEEEPKPAEEPRAQSGAKGPRVVIVGAGIAGASAAEAVREGSPGAEIVILSKEDRLPYYRLNLTRYLAGEVTADQLPLHPSGWYDDKAISTRLGQAAASIDLSSKEVALRSGEALPFDRLIVTAGSHPFVPPIPGSSREGVTALRTPEDADRILEASRRASRCVCIGGGVLGLETAGALARHGVPVTVVEGFGWLLPRQLDQRAGELLAEHVRKLGIDLVFSARVRELVGDECVRGVEVEDRGVIDADVVVMATGVRSNSYLAREAGLEVNHGLVVDNHLRASHPDVFAAGDVAEHRGVVYGIWGPSQYQGAIAGMNAAGGQVEFGGIPRSNTLKVLGVDLYSVGLVAPEDGSYEVLRHEADEGRYYRFVFHDNALVGAILLGDLELTSKVKTLVESGTDLSSLLKGRPRAQDVVEHLAGRP